MWCGKCAASNGIACGSDNNDICAKNDDYTLSVRRCDAQSPKHVVSGATRASKTVAFDATVVGVMFTHSVTHVEIALLRNRKPKI